MAPDDPKQLRAWFAGMAMNAMLKRTAFETRRDALLKDVDNDGLFGEDDYAKALQLASQEVAKDAVAIADAMMEEFVTDTRR